MDARKFWTMCRLHDWFYQWSDDPGVYRAGRDSLETLEMYAAKSPEHRAIYDAWHAHYFESGPKPVEPKMEDAE